MTPYIHFQAVLALLGVEGGYSASAMAAGSNRCKMFQETVSTIEYSYKLASECDLVVAVAKELFMAWVGLLVSGSWAATR
mmetsp:Transcript_56277/g.96882  ORF Transcript_56277/g.96882 Transcript_56277/m.96882 type:complete len:80 (-) Transcript_56277:422-661(-)